MKGQFHSAKQESPKRGSESPRNSLVHMVWAGTSLLCGLESMQRVEKRSISPEMAAPAYRWKGGEVY
jgi:hypothetical protein